MAPLGPHHDVTGRERASEHGSGVLLLLGSGWGPKVSRFHSLFVSLKYKNGNLKLRKRKNKWPNGQLSKSTKIFKTKGSSGGRQPGSLWLATCLFETAISEADATFEVDAISEADAVFEADASLKRMPWQSKLKSGTCRTKKRRPNSQGLPYCRTR